MRLCQVVLRLLLHAPHVRLLGLQTAGPSTKQKKVFRTFSIPNPGPGAVVCRLTQSDLCLPVPGRIPLTNTIGGGLL